MASPRKSPRRSSLAPQSVNTMDLSDATNATLPVTNKDFDRHGKAKENHAGSTFAFHVGKEGGDKLTPTALARRSARPRKSILKPNFASLNEDDTIEISSASNQAHTVNFGDLSKARESLARRVSFAANAHVRMFDKKAEQEKRRSTMGGRSALKPSTSDPTMSKTVTAPRSSLSHSRRSSIQNIGSITQPQPARVVAVVDESEVSMDIETDEEADSDADASGVDMGGRRISTGSAQSENDDGQEEMDMDETEVYGAGILRRQSNISERSVDDSDASFASSVNTDEERTMDFTIAIGGIVPPVPPVNAARNRQSLPYSLPESPNSHDNRLRPGQAMADESDMSVEMDETVAFGGIVGDDTFSSGSDGNTADHGRDPTVTFNYRDISTAQIAAAAEDDEAEDAMEMTVAMGGIIDLPTASPASLSTRFSVNGSITRPSPSATSSSYARPTVASAQRSREPTPKKRNIFGPSPSPHHQATPRSSGMAVAGEVAKRLSFGSTTSSGGKKRPADADEEEAGSAKKARPTIAQNIFAPEAPAPLDIAEAETSPTPAKETTVKPRKSLPRNLRENQSPAKISFTPETVRQRMLASPARSLGARFAGNLTPQSQRKRLLLGSPARSPHVRQMMGEYVPQEELDQANEFALELEPPMIQLSDFLRMAKVEFMEDLPKGRSRGSMARGLLSRSTNAADRDIALGEYAEAEVRSVFLRFYTWAANQTEEDIADSRAKLEALEQAHSTDNPMVIRHYLSATDEEKVLFESTFNAFKTNTGLKAREQWYLWKEELLPRLLPDVEAIYRDMKEDAARLNEMEAQTEELLPELQARLESLEKELEKERAAVQEIAECDQEELAALREAIAEQTVQIDTFTADLNESTDKLKKLSTKLEEIDRNKKACEGRISAAKSMCDQYTRSDIIRFKEEYESIQALHGWRVDKLTAGEVVLNYDNQIRLIVPCREHAPELQSSSIEWTANPIKGKFKHGQEINEGMFAMVQSGFLRIVKSCSTISDLVQRTGSMINASQRLRAELGFMTMRLPTSYRTVATAQGKGVVVSAAMMLKALKSKVELCFLLTPDTLLSWPGGLAHVEVEARTTYGSADPEIMKRAARDTIAETRDEGYIGALLQACIDAQAQHEV